MIDIKEKELMKIESKKAELMAEAKVYSKIGDLAEVKARENLAYARADAAEAWMEVLKIATEGLAEVSARLDIEVGDPLKRLKEGA